MRESELLTIVPLLSDPYLLLRKTGKREFHNSYHHHPEIQLEYIVKGSGVQVIGDTYGRFQQGDMVLLGSGLPHLRKPDTLGMEAGLSEDFEVITLIFSRKLFSETLLSMTELNSVERLLEKCKQGIVIRGITNDQVAELMKASFEVNMVQKVAMLLEMLLIISTSSETDFILTHPPDSAMSEQSTSRISNIYSFVLDHFREKITIKQIAEVANLSEHTFCRYFKQKFNTTFSSFLNELRINYASTLLVETEHSISEVCFKSGFNNFTNFNKRFKVMQKSTPTEYRKKYQNLRIEQSIMQPKL